MYFGNGAADPRARTAPRTFDFHPRGSAPAVTPLVLECERIFDKKIVNKQRRKKREKKILCKKFAQRPEK